MKNQKLKHRFPVSFVFGAATAGIQNEGISGRGTTVWDKSFELKPEKFYKGQGPEVTSDFVNKHKEDIELAKKSGVKALRISIEWSRVLEDYFNYKLRPGGLEFYDELIDLLIANDIEPFVCLNHWGTPIEIEEKGGWSNRETANHFLEFSKIVINRYKDKVTKWFTFNEPTANADQPYLNKRVMPWEIDFKKAVQAAYNVNIASAMVVKHFKENNFNGEIGIIIAMSVYYSGSNSKEDKEATELAEALLRNSFLYPSIHGYFPKILIDFVKKHDLYPDIKSGDKKLLLENTIDHLGANYYYPTRIKARKNKLSGPLTPQHFFETYVDPHRRINKHRGWEIFPQGLYDLGLNIKNNYKNIKWYITENGMGVENEGEYRNSKGIISDDYRIDFYKEHLYYLLKAINDGSNCHGFICWNLVDNWSWVNGYKNRYGLIEVDIINQKRKLKESALWFNEISKTKILKYNPIMEEDKNGTA